MTKKEQLKNRLKGCGCIMCAHYSKTTLRMIDPETGKAAIHYNCTKAQPNR